MWNKVLFNFENDYARGIMKHVLFHEFTHAIVDRNIGEYGEYRKKDITPHPTRDFKTIKRDDEYETVIHPDFPRLLDEIIAEATACDLLNDYQLTRTRAPFIKEPTITSNWIVPYNRDYQQLGFEFLRTVLPNSYKKSDRELFRELTLRFMRKNNEFGKEIMDIYEKKHPLTWKEDLHEITEILAKLVNREEITAEQIKRVRELMKKYNRGFIVISRTNGENRTEN